MAEIGKRFCDLGSDGAPAKLGILGGTFDPIHLGHLAAAEGVRRACGLDAVLFVPAGSPVYKRDTVVAPAADRLEMCRLAIEDNPSFDVSNLEIARGGDTYTVDTLRTLRERYPDNVALYLIVGTDAAESLWKWREASEVARLARTVVAARPGYELSATDRANLVAKGFADPLIVTCPTLDVSSSELRTMAGSGVLPRYLVADSVRRYIAVNGLYREAPAPTAAIDEGDPLSDAFFEARRRELADRVKPRRFRHCEGVSQTAVELAHIYGADERKARLAGILHDWDKGYDDEGIRARARDLDLLIDPYVYENMPGVMHGPTAAAGLARAFPTIPADVISSIERHTSGAEDMSDLDMIVYVADAIEPSRDFPTVDDLRKLVGKVSLEELFFAVFRGTFMGLLDGRRLVHPGTEKVWNYYAARARARGKDKKNRKKGNK